MTQVDAVVTDYTTSDVVGAFITAYGIVTGTDSVSDTSWSFPAAQAIYAEGWKNQYALNNNVGNLTWPMPGAERTAGWYYNPHVTTGAQFSSYDTLVDGCVGMLRWLARKGVLPYADAGDSAGYVQALAAGGYLGPGEDYSVYQRNIEAGAAQLANVVPSSAPAPTRTSGWKIALGVLGILGASGTIAWWITKRPPRKLALAA